jgi:hypothetical protein
LETVPLKSLHQGKGSLNFLPLTIERQASIKSIGFSILCIGYKKNPEKIGVITENKIQKRTIEQSVFSIR